MTEEVNFQLDIASEQMQEAIMHLENVLAKIRAGKANPQMLRTVKVDYYGVQTPLSQAANVSTTDAQTISVQPFDKSLIAEIENAITEANLGFNPSNNGSRSFTTFTYVKIFPHIAIFTYVTNTKFS